MDSSSGNTSDDASDTPPKRFKGDNGHPQLPDSILKDEPLEEAETAPHRERRKSRKSVGRRVSFAPTAHVRMFEVPEEKQQAAPNSNTYEMPDISSQTGMLGFNLGIMPAVEETSMASNESFDVSVRHSDPSESLQSSEGSFSADTGHGSVGSPAAPAAHRHGNGQEQRYASILDNDDDDDDDEDLDEADGDDAVTMELTGTVDMGAIGNDDESDAGSSGGAGGGEELSPSNLTSGFRAADSEATPLLDSVDASNFFSMLMQSNAADQHTSLLDNILSQFGDMPQSMSTDYTMNSIRDTDLTRVAVPVDDSGDELDTVVQADISGPAANELANAAGSDGSVGGGDDDDHDDDNDDDDDDADDMEMGHDVDDAVTMDLTGVVSRWSGDSGLGAGGEMDEQAGAIDIATWADEDIPVAPAKQPTFVLDPLPPIPRPIAPPAAGVACGPASRAELAKAGLVMGIFETYRHQRLVPEASPAVAQLAEVPLKFEPLFRKSELKARLEYCSALSGLFEADHCVSRAAAAEPMAFGELASFFGAQNELLSDRREELLLRISRMRQRLVQEAPGKETGKLFGETQELRMKLLGAKREREAIGADIEQLGAEIQALQTTGTSFDRQLSERKSAQEVLLAINGLQPVDVGADCCDFIYDGFSRLHFGDSAEFTSLHPDIDWAAAIRGAIGSSDLSMRQYTIAAMKANAVLKGLLEDVRRVKRHTFVELLYSDGIYVRLQFFSRAHRQRFHLQIPLASVESYTRLHLETEFDWATDVLYGDVDAVRLRECLRACRIDPSLPVLSIYEHVESSMGAF
ncbi:hypothetical protein LPJ61_000715 [Coemansia biformis]|uniref:Spc7 kinetochore protein domain-containing protein n=1 Tax=Coemansia biformis TaxID=1286918 RepID=A0A9W8CXY1_9FUNG|nr:hypothetical protein LPJ61_000715 [Coemansia biformis]